MKVLVTGSSGFIGKAVVKALLRRGFDVVGVGRSTLAEAPYKYISVDLIGRRDFRQLFDSERPDALIHLAWETTPGDYWNSPDNSLWVSATTQLFSDFCAAGGARAVFVGTCAEYDWSVAPPYTESHALSSSTPYGRAKSEASRKILALSDQLRVPAAWARVFFPYGAGEKPQKIIPRIISSFNTGERLLISGEDQWDFLHIDDIARALVLIVESEFCGAVNVASGVPIKMSSLVDSLGRLLGKMPKIEYLSVASYVPKKVYALPTVLSSLGWVQHVNIDQGLDDLLGKK